MEPFEALTVALARKPTILEVFSGHSEITIQARAFGWQPLQPFELAYGEDALDAEDKRKLLEFIKKEKPDLVVITPPCGPWSPLQNLTADRELLALKRELHRPLWALTRQIWDIQEQNQRLAMTENPMLSPSSCPRW